ncbi:MAG: hypothetical protein V7677_11535 [Motiliproteus sp.]
MLPQLLNAKRSFLTRNLDLSNASHLKEQAPMNGDLVLARVDRIRQHTRLEDTHGRRMFLYPHDEILLVAGSRYASDQFHAQLPKGLGPCHLVAAGGIAAQVVNKSDKVRPATEITLLGVVADAAGDAINLRTGAVLPLSSAEVEIPVILVIGSAMNAGKTTTACALIHGLRINGYAVAGAKLTGTGAGPDYWRMKDAGAVPVLDFVDHGLASSVGVCPQKLVAMTRSFSAEAQRQGADYLVLEVADGILQPETRALVATEEFSRLIAGVLIAADSSAAAVMIAQTLSVSGYPVYGISGILSRSPLSCEETRTATGLPVFQPEDFDEIDIIEYIRSSAQRDQIYANASTG